MIIFFYGANDFFSRQKIKELKDKFIREIDPDEHSISVISGRTADFREIIDATRTGSLFTKKRLIIIEEIFLNSKKTVITSLRSHLEENSEESSDNILVFHNPEIKNEKNRIVKTGANGNENFLVAEEKKLFDYLQKQKFVQEFKALTPFQAADWARKESAAAGLRLSNLAAQELMSLTGGDLWQLRNELNKLIHYTQAKGQPEISASDVKEMVEGKFSDNIFNLTDAWGGKNLKLAAALLEDQFSLSAAPEYLTSMLLRHFKIMLQVKEAQLSGKKENEIATQIGLHPFVAKKSLSQSARFPVEQLRQIIRRLTEIDYSFKSGKGEIKLMLNLLLAKNI